MVREWLLPDDDSKTHYAPGSEIDRATFRAHRTQGVLWPTIARISAMGREHALYAVDLEDAVNDVRPD